MLNAGQRREAILGLTFGLPLLLLPTCGKSTLGISKDASLPKDIGGDSSQSDTSPIVHDDVAPPLPDLATTPDLAPDNSVPPADLPSLRDTPGDPTWFVDLRDAFSPDIYAIDDGRKDIILPTEGLTDRPPITDLRPDLVSHPDLPPVVDLNPAPDELPPPKDTYVTLDEGPGLSTQCTSSGGAVGTRLCCSSSSYFLDTCSAAVGACGCSPSSSVTVDVCNCPSGGCFLPGYGCVGPASTCTVGMNQTCNDSPTISSIHGQCVTGGRCLCTNFALSATSGKCL
jgi:hypothetical protein